MKITATLAIISLASSHRRGGGFANARLLAPNIEPLNPVIDFSDLAIKWVEQSERGPTISGHFMVHVNSALFDAYAAFEDGTTGVFTELAGLVQSALTPDLTVHAQLYAMADAAYDVITTLGQTLLNQKYLEIDNFENCTERLPILLGEAEALRDKVINEVNLVGDALTIAQSVSAAVSLAVLTRVTQDGSNYQNDFKDTTGYAVRPWCLPVPSLDDGIKDYDFLDGSYTFNTYNAVKANQVSNYGFATVHKRVKAGSIRLTETYQSLTEHGIFPPAKDGGQQFPLTAHWGGVSPLSLSSSSELRTPVFGPYGADGKLNDQWVEEAREVVNVACKQQDKVCPRCRAESEYWELGDEFPYPPGWWVLRATEIAREKGMGVKESLQVILGVSITVFDAGIASWEMKFFYDTVRPVTAINELFEGSKVCDWRGNQTAFIDDRDHWRPYQLRRNTVPPFPDIPSGHSAFSTSSSVVLRNLLGTNVFDYTTEPFKSRFDLVDGFDGDPDTGNELTVLNWKTFSQAADAAGYSRIYGGIHMMQGNILGLEMGARVGHSTLAYLRHLFGDENLGQDPVGDIFNNIIFGTGGDDAHLVAPCVQDSSVEVYGFYGDDGKEEILEFDDPGNCGPVSLFGGDGADTFRIGAKVTIQDYETQDSIVLLQEYDVITTSVTDSVTTVFIGGAAVLDVDGVWATNATNQLNIVFED
ncbi:hypothetical protein ACHAXR_010308 [Thalassiosira sp. AJA248-18]